MLWQHLAGTVVKATLLVSASEQHCLTCQPKLVGHYAVIAGLKSGVVHVEHQAVQHPRDDSEHARVPFHLHAFVRMSRTSTTMSHACTSTSGNAAKERKWCGHLDGHDAVLFVGLVVRGDVWRQADVTISTFLFHIIFRPLPRCRCLTPDSVFVPTADLRRCSAAKCSCWHESICSE